MEPTPAEGKHLEPLADDLDALSNLQRLRLVHLLTRPRYAEEIAEALGMSRQSALKHIEKLEERGFVRALHGRRATGPVIEYVMVPQRLFALGVSIGELGKLEPEGGPSTRLVERTQAIPEGEVVPQPALGPATSAAHLLVLSGPNAGTRVELAGPGPRWTIGRDDDRDVRLGHDPFVSGRHAEVQVDWKGFAVVDVFSANGSTVNFVRMPRGGRVPLKAGDVIGVGHTLLVYQKE